MQKVCKHDFVERGYGKKYPIRKINDNTPPASNISIEINFCYTEQIANDVMGFTLSNIFFDLWSVKLPYPSTKVLINTIFISCMYNPLVNAVVIK